MNLPLRAPVLVLLLLIQSHLCAQEAASTPAVQFEDPVVVLQRVEAVPSITPLVPNLESPLTLADALQSSNVRRAAELLGTEDGKFEARRDAAELLPLTIQMKQRDLLVQFLKSPPRGLFWQENTARRMVQALWERDAELVRLLREAHPALPRAPGRAENLLAYAVAWNAPEQLRLLLETGSDPNEKLLPVRDEDFLNLLATPQQRAMVSADTDVTPLILATALGYDEVMKVLLQAGANPYATTKNGVNAVTVAGNQWERLQLLLDDGKKHDAPYHIRVDLSERRAWFYEGKQLVMKSIVSTGKPKFETPTGRFFVTDKARSKTSSLYEVEMPYFLRLNGSALGLHAGPTNGRPISHGCIRLPEEAAKLLFKKAPVGTLVTIEG